MRISRFVVENYRSIRHQEIALDPLTAFVGRNGAGKSTVLHAIELFYSTSAPIEAEDYYGKDPAAPIMISVTYAGLSRKEKDEFAPYMSHDELTVKKVITLTEGTCSQKYYGSTRQHPDFAPIRALAGKRDQMNAWNSLVESGRLPEVGARVKRSDEIEPQMLEYESGHSDQLVLIENEHQFFGPTNIGGGKLDNYTKFVMVPAVREAQDEVATRKGSIYQLLDMIVRRQVENRKDVIEFRQEFERRIREVYSSDNLTELPALAGEISKTLATYAPGVRLLLDWDDPALPALPLPNALASLEEDGFQTDIKRKGHGLQRALILTLLQYLAGAKPAVEPVPPAQEVEAGSVEQVASPDLILAIEEPELYQHPLRSRFLCDVLYQLSLSWQHDSAPRNQVLYTTHSPYFISLDRFDSVRRVIKASAESGKACSEQACIHSFTLGDAAKEAARTAGPSAASSFTATGFLSRARTVMNTIVNEGFFADVVLVVEGNTEHALFWRLQEILGKQWHRKGIAVVPAFGKNNVDRPVIIFRGLKIPTYFVFDGDSSHRGKDGERDSADRNRRYMLLAGVPPEEFPATRVERDWATFEDRIETTIRAEIGEERFIEARKVAAEEASLDAESSVLKNHDGATLFLDHVYSKGVRVPVLERIVTNVEALLP
jgi:putative ATP-dependent endonuclease of OLD family